MASPLVMAPSLFRLLVLGGLMIYFEVAARHEERKFARSTLAEEYARYRQRTGRFLPKFSAMRR
jgi:protein-S-isoprenylcysteine O-methyltransferase Ste14